MKDMAKNEKTIDALITSIQSGWPQKCDGLTPEEAEKLGYDIDDEDWLDEVED